MTTPRLMRRLMLKAGYAPVDVVLEAPQVVEPEPTLEPAPKPKPQGRPLEKVKKYGEEE